MSDVPLWIQTLQALATPVIGATAGALAFMQWRTSHQKVVLDLFDRRWKAIEAIKDAVRPILRDGCVRHQGDVIGIYNAMYDAHLLFGEDIHQLLERYKKVIANISVGSSYAEDIRNPQYERGTDLLHDGMLKMINFYGELDLICARYMRMDQKLIRTPGQWLADRNKKRLSYADEKQR